MAGISDKAAKTQYVQNKYRYNGKELQNQEFADGSGLEENDYGARYYYQQLGRWTTPDPKAEKFFPSSPYTYTVDDPILLPELDGKDWTITRTEDKKGNVVYNILFTGAVLNSSSNKNINMQALASTIQTQIEKMFSGLIEKNSDGTVKVGIEIHALVDAINKKSDLLSDQTLFEVKDPSDKDFQTNSPGSRVLASANNGKEIAINENEVNNIINGGNSKTIPHEAGHTAGLRHSLMDFNSYLFGLIRIPGATANSPRTNFMYQGPITNPTGPTKEQIERMYRLYQNGDLNKSTGTLPIDKND
jgi:RHS repeat-associated protein